MKRILLFVAITGVVRLYAQQYPYNPSPENPFGKLNPEAPKEVADFREMIGACDCRSVTRLDQNTWADTVQMTWVFRYIMNGTAIQDETFKADGLHSGSIRQYSTDSSQWIVHYYSTATPVTLPSWMGKREGDKIVLYRKQAAPNGTPGFYRLTFYNLSAEGYNWVGEWVNEDETFTYPTWKIFCRKRTYSP